jgi:hypothetical protein
MWIFHLQFLMSSIIPRHSIPSNSKTPFKSSIIVSYMFPLLYQNKVSVTEKKGSALLLKKKVYIIYTYIYVFSALYQSYSRSFLSYIPHTSLFHFKTSWQGREARKGRTEGSFDSYFSTFQCHM